MKWNHLMTVTSLVVGLSACSEEPKTTEIEEGPMSNVEVVEEPETPEVVEEEASPWGVFENLVGSWTVDAKTAGVKMDLTFGEDGSFKQDMGVVKGAGTWEVVDDEHIKIVTQNTKGQTWKITELSETGVNVCWNPDKPNPKTIPMQRVK